MKTLKYVLYSFVVCFFAISLNAQITPQEAVTLMGKGINLGNTLDGLPTEGSWYPSMTEEYYFAAYKEAGFNNIRIPVTWQEHFESDSSNKVKDEWMDRVEQIVDWGLAQGLFITLNAHHDGWIKHSYTDENIAKFDSLWIQISTRFKDKSDRLVFEILNEAEDMTVTQLNETHARVLGIIRETNPTRIVLYSGNGWNTSTDLLETAIPDLNDEYLMGFFHAYDPWDFVGGKSSWYGTENNLQSLRNNMVKVQNWSIQNNIPVILNEWGATHDCDYNQKMRYLAHYSNIIVNHGFAFSYWDDGGLFRMYEREDNKWDDSKDAILHFTGFSPDSLMLENVGDNIQLSWVNRIDVDSLTLDSTVIERRQDTLTFMEVATIADEQIFIDDSGIEDGSSYYYRVRNYLSDGSNQVSYSQVIYSICKERFLYLGEAHAVPGVIEAEDFDVGCNGLTYNDGSLANVPGEYRDESVDIEKRADGGYQVAYVEQGEWIEYTVNVATAGDYTIESHTASLSDVGRLSYDFNGEFVTMVIVPATGGWETVEVVKADVTLSAGEQIMRLNIESENPFNIDKISIIEGHHAGVQSLITNDSFKVYPNPANENIHVSCKQDNYTLELLDLNGRILEYEKVNRKNAIIDISSLSGGIYIVRVTSANHSYNKRIIVE